MAKKSWLIKPKSSSLNDPFNGYDYVDMGDAGYWATCNIGATKPEEYGLYFEWGGIEGYTSDQIRSGNKEFSTRFSDYRFSGEGATGFNPQLTKYCNDLNYGKDKIFTDSLTILEYEDDAAHVNMGGSWRMPTLNEFQKLYNDCNVSWESNYQGKGISGRLFILKNDSSKKIFFPAAGYCHSNSVINVNFDGDYWSSSLYSSNPCNSYSLYFNSGTVGPQLEQKRYYGFSIRGFIPKS